MPEDACDTDEDCQHTKDNDQRADVGPRRVEERPRTRIDRAGDEEPAAVFRPASLVDVGAPRGTGIRQVNGPGLNSRVFSAVGA